MNNAHDSLKAAARLLDPRFNYIPAVETDIATTWRRFGFNPHANRQRRERLRDPLHEQAPAAVGKTESPAPGPGQQQLY